MVCSSSSDIQGRLRKYPFTEIGTFKTFIPELEPLLPSSNYGVKTQHLRITSALLKCLRQNMISTVVILLYFSKAAYEKIYAATQLK